jgi:hypothetical protein
MRKSMFPRRQGWSPVFRSSSRFKAPDAPLNAELRFSLCFRIGFIRKVRTLFGPMHQTIEKTLPLRG